MSWEDLEAVDGQKVSPIDGVFARLSSSSDMADLMDWLKGQTMPACPDDITDEELRYREGQRALVQLIDLKLQRARDERRIHPDK